MVGTLITLSGNASDPDGDAPIYSWTFASVPVGSALTSLDSATTLSPSFTPDVAGDYIVTLTVSDGATTTSDNVIITATTITTPTGLTELVSVSTAGVEGDSGSYSYPTSISADGRYVAFSSDRHQPGSE